MVEVLKRYKMEKKKNLNRIWAAMVLAVFIWIPVINIVCLSIGVYLVIRQIMLIKKTPEIYGGKEIALIWLFFGLFLLIFSIRGFILSIS